jgi:enamine deaminase RidA (YjgF/YER057c/UK114 family)
MNTVYAEYFSGENPPARATVGAQLPGDFDIEIEFVVAMKK